MIINEDAKYKTNSNIAIIFIIIINLLFNNII